GTGRGAEQGDRLTGRDLLGEQGDALALLLHLFQVAAAVLVPANRVPPLAVEVGGQLLAGPEVAPPPVPGLLLLRQRRRPVTADQQAEAVVGVLVLVPALGLDHGPSLHPGAAARNDLWPAPVVCPGAAAVSMRVWADRPISPLAPGRRPRPCP